MKLINYKKQIISRYNTLPDNEHNLVLMCHNLDLCMANILSLLATADSKFNSINIYCDSPIVEEFCTYISEQIKNTHILKHKEILAKYKIYRMMKSNNYKYLWWMKPIFMIDTILDRGQNLFWSDLDIVYLSPISKYFNNNNLWFFPNHIIQLGKYRDGFENLKHSSGIVICNTKIKTDTLKEMRTEAIEQIKKEIKGEEETIWDNEQGFVITRFYSAIKSCRELPPMKFRLLKFHALNDRKSNERSFLATKNLIKNMEVSALHMVAGAWKDMLPCAEQLAYLSTCETWDNTSKSDQA